MTTTQGRNGKDRTERKEQGRRETWKWNRRNGRKGEKDKGGDGPTRQKREGKDGKEGTEGKEGHEKSEWKGMSVRKNKAEHKDGRHVTNEEQHCTRHSDPALGSCTRIQPSGPALGSGTPGNFSLAWHSDLALECRIRVSG